MQEALYIIYLLAAAAVLCLFRIARGPTAPDRVVALDALIPIVAVMMVLSALYQGNDMLMDIALIYTLLGFVGTLVISKYLLGEKLGSAV